MAVFFIATAKPESTCNSSQITTSSKEVPACGELDAALKKTNPIEVGIAFSLLILAFFVFERILSFDNKKKLP